MREIENRDMDNILRQSLVPDHEPDSSLNQQILRQAQEQLSAGDFAQGILPGTSCLRAPEEKVGEGIIKLAGY